LLGTLLTSIFGYFIGTMFLILSIPAVFVALGMIIRENPMGIEDTILDIPVLGPIYERLFRPATYYKIDTALMFQSAVHAAVMQVVDAITQGQGIRALSEEQRKPIMREFFQR
jgi:hypothetical protein